MKIVYYKLHLKHLLTTWKEKKATSHCFYLLSIFSNTDSPTISIINQNLTVDDNFTQLICQPHGNPVIYKFYQWEHHSVYGEKIRTFDSGLDGILKIPKSKRAQRYHDSGIYKCFAENGVADKNGKKIQSGSVMIVKTGIYYLIFSVFLLLCYFSIFKKYSNSIIDKKKN